MGQAKLIVSIFAAMSVWAFVTFYGLTPLLDTSRPQRYPIQYDNAVNSSISVEVMSSIDRVSLAVNGHLVYESDVSGLHVLVLSESTGRFLMGDMFDATSKKGTDELILKLLNEDLANKSRWVVVAMSGKDEATFVDELRNHFRERGSQLFPENGAHCTFALMLVNGKVLVEDRRDKGAKKASPWAEPLVLTAQPMVQLEEEEFVCQRWINTAAGVKLHELCQDYEGYGSLCTCGAEKPSILSLLDSGQFASRDFQPTALENIPVAVMAGKRPKMLLRALESIFQADLVVQPNLHVYICGYQQETGQVADLFGIGYTFVPGIGEGNTRIGNHYKQSLERLFAGNDQAKYAIILEEDLLVSPDFFRYMLETLPVLESDSSLFTISAWNDQGYPQVAQDPARLIRTNTFPGLGWILQRRIFEDELVQIWPSMNKDYVWDNWVRERALKNRDSIIPEIPRTKHIGSRGTNVGLSMQKRFFETMAFNQERGVQYKGLTQLTKADYDAYLHSAISAAKVVVLAPGAQPCGPDFLAGNGSVTQDRVFYFHQENKSDLSTWSAIAECNELWISGSRGTYFGVHNLGTGRARLFLVGAPYSPFREANGEGVPPYTFPE